ncbi:MAG: type II toxin-antitoxin system HicB family antitoxin [Candidatus Omnitrophota bacterium]
MNQGDKYVKIVEWSDEDRCFIGSCPELFYGGCHGSDAKSVFAELCELVDETIKVYKQEDKPLPNAMSGRDFVNAMQRIA